MDKFLQGYACAVACIVKGHGDSTETREALISAGLTSRKKLQAAGIEEYDYKILLPLVDAISSERIRQAKELKRLYG
jgi:hypothetical protein